MSTNPIIDFAAAIAAAGLGTPKDGVVADGKVHRFRTRDDRTGALSGWYALHLTGTPAGIFGSWKHGITDTWCSVSREEQTPKQRAELKAIIDKARRQRDEETRQRNAKTAEAAKAMLDKAKPADPNHPYLRRKQVEPHGVCQLAGELLIPVYIGDALTSLQRIAPNGAKRFLAGGAIKGGCHLISDQARRDELLIAEGFATAASLHEHTGAAVHVAFNSGNLLAVAQAVRKSRPHAEIIIAGDNDAWTVGNPGATAARKAAKEVGAKLLIPDFTGFDPSTKPTDWNDYYRLLRAKQEWGSAA